MAAAAASTLRVASHQLLPHHKERMDHSDTNDANSIDGADFISDPSSQLDRDVTMKRRSFSHEYYGRIDAACTSNMQDDCDEVRSTSSAEQSQLNHPSLNNSVLQTTSIENSYMTGHQRQNFRDMTSVSGSARQRRRTQGDMLVMGADESHAHTINRERANTCPQHQFHHYHDLVETEGTQQEAEIFSGQDEESGGVGRDDFRLHGSDGNERRAQSLPSAAAVSFPEYQAARTSVVSSPRRRAASASSIIAPLQQTPATATTTTAMPFSLLHARTTTTTASSTTNFISSYTITTVKHTLLKLFMLISIYQLLSYTYNTGLSPELIEMNYGIEEYWYGGRLWSNRLSASRIVGSSGISFNDDYDGGTTGEEEEDQEEEEDESVVGFIASVLSEKFGFLNEGGEGIVDDEGELQHEEVVAAANDGGGDVVSPSKLDYSTLEKKSGETTATRIIDANNNKVTKRRPAMAHVISISDARRPAYLPRASSSRRMKTKDARWTLSRIAGALIWVGLMIPILEVGIRQVSRRYRLGSLLRRRMRMMRGAFRRGSSENVHIL